MQRTFEALEQRHSGPSQNEDGKEDDDEGGGDENAPRFRSKFQVERQGVGDGAAEAAEPHDKHHLSADFVRPESVHQHRERENVENPT